MKRGFTLVELLGVIVVLAFVALITVPIVLSVINKSDDAATRRSAENYRKAIKEAVAKANLSGNRYFPTRCTVIEQGESAGYLSCVLKDNSTKELVIKMEGTYPKSGTITFSESEPVETILYYKGCYVEIDEKGSSKLTKTDG